MKTSKVGIVAMAILAVVAIARTSTAGDFKLGDFKGTYVSELPGNMSDGTHVHGYLYLIADGVGGATVKFSYAAPGASHTAEEDAVYTVSPEGYINLSVNEGTYIITLNGYLANSSKEILGFIVFDFLLFDIYATVHGVQQ